MLKNAALYIRVSTQKQDELSPAAQERLLKEYATNNKLTVSGQHIYIDSGISGRSADKRPAFQKMIADAKANKFDAVLVWKFSRFARNQEESIVYKSMLKNKCNVDVVSITETLDDNPFSTLIERIIEWMDEYYSIRLSGEVSRGMDQAVLSKKNTTAAPFGYTALNGSLVIHETEGELVRQIFKKFIAGEGPFEIASWLNEMGIKTSRGNQFEPRSISYIINNKKYMGIFRNGYDAENGQWRVEQEGCCPVLIDKETWDSAQNIKAKCKSNTKRILRQDKHFLSGLVKCSSCGRALTVSKYGKYVDGTDKIGFQCWGYSHAKCSKSHFVSESILMQAIMNGLNELATSSFRVPFELVRADEYASRNEQLSMQLKKLYAKLDRCKYAYTEGIDTIEEYKINKTMLSNEITIIEKELEQSKDLQILDVDVDIRKDVEALCQLLNSDADSISKGNALRSVVKEIVYHVSEKVVQIKLYKAF